MSFFSSRRRHTRWPRDWCSDVCSSDLPFSPDCFTSANKQQRVSSSAQKPGRSTSSLPSRYGSFTQRSEEHTSELQSRGHLVCRLLPEKKNIITVLLKIDVQVRHRSDT